MMTLFWYLVLGLIALILSAFAARLKTQGLIISGWIAVGLMTLIIVTHLRFVSSLFQDEFFFGLLILGALYILPIIFLASAGTKNNNSVSGAADSLDGAGYSGAVTQEYLEEIINAPDEDINFEDDLNLK